MGIMVYSLLLLLWVMQGLYHQPYFSGIRLEALRMPCIYFWDMRVNLMGLWTFSVQKRGNRAKPHERLTGV